MTKRLRPPNSVVHKAKQKELYRVLKPREQSFVSNYVVLMNGAAAVYASNIASSNSRQTTASGIAKALLKDPAIASAIQVQLDYQAARCAITKTRITAMLLDLFEEAKQDDDIKTRHSIAVDIAKLHGLMVATNKVEFSWSIEDLDESQIIKFLGKRYDSGKIDKLINVIDAEPQT